MRERIEESQQLLSEGGQLKQLAERCRKLRTSLSLVLLRHAFFRLHGKKILTSNRVRIQGLKNIQVDDYLMIGLSYFGFVSPKDRTFLNVEGELVFKNPFGVSKGCRFDIGKDARVEFGSGYISPGTDVIIVHGMTVGDDCAISWGCQFLDDDFHELEYEGKSEEEPQIRIGSHVWIGSRVMVLKGSAIPDGCVVAANSVVNRVFTEKNCLLAGIPAEVIRRDISWK